MRSFEDSLNRLGADRIDILLIHDVDRRNQGERFPEVFRAAMTGPTRPCCRCASRGWSRQSAAD